MEWKIRLIFVQPELIPFRMVMIVAIGNWRFGGEAALEKDFPAPRYQQLQMNTPNHYHLMVNG
jgi:hypothetical protein